MTWELGHIGHIGISSRSWKSAPIYDPLLEEPLLFVFDDLISRLM